MSETARYWQQIYTTKAPDAVSWYQARPQLSLDLIAQAGIGPAAQIIDIGGGASTLVDALLAQQFQHITVLDIAPAALERAQARLGPAAAGVTWLAADVTQAPLPASYDLWHDRAVFHFLTEAADRARYVAAAERALPPGAQLIIATFAPDGPQQCSGLAVVRYSAEALAAALGPAFALVSSCREAHQTPFSTTQHFLYSWFRRQR